MDANANGARASQGHNVTTRKNDAHYCACIAAACSCVRDNFISDYSGEHLVGNCSITSSNSYTYDQSPTYWMAALALYDYAHDCYGVDDGSYIRVDVWRDMEDDVQHYDCSATAHYTDPDETADEGDV